MGETISNQVSTNFTYTVDMIYDRNVEIPEGWKFVYFDVPSKDDSWVEYHGAVNTPEMRQKSTYDRSMPDRSMPKWPRIIVRKVEEPKFVNLDKWVWKWGGTELRDCKIKASDVYPGLKIPENQEKNIWAFRPYVSSDRIIKWTPSGFFIVDMYDSNGAFNSPSLIVGEKFSFDRP